MKVLYLLPGLLAASFACQAQTTTTVDTTNPIEASAYQVQYDSLQARANRVRAQSADGTQSVKTSFVALGGTRRTILSLGTPRSIPTTSGIPVARDSPLKKEIVKHKTHGAIVRKVTYLRVGHRRLYEYYEDGQLVQLELYDYPLAASNGSITFVTMRWLRGNYLTVAQQRRTSAGGRVSQTQAFAVPALIAQ